MCLSVCLSVDCEWDYVLVSTVRSLPQRDIDSQPSDKWRAKNLGLVSDQQQLNVAITRARQGLIIIGMYTRTSLSSRMADSGCITYCLCDVPATTTTTTTTTTTGPLLTPVLV